ncbi:hypothetical protein DEALK_06400 [Dehalogenimonas alkenigignens]|uniref:Uncharacterized protein n=1 Tax=Dehalogenimonas alkenigignens TaxID=1217799 RepID=A0A0W0GGW0_9CHLR|nr:hypothetical protein [Dehalogenimonas alkenigignens]KTB47795.1 hypothetical protein DEALK_06400 [Dehalogenimonas alkenigignens]
MAKLEHELEVFFKSEAAAALPPPDFWRTAVSKATVVSQRPVKKSRLATWFSDLLEALHIDARRLVLGIATYLVLLLVIAGLSAGVSIYVSGLGIGDAPPTITSGTIPPHVTPTVTVVIPQNTSNALFAALLGVSFALFAAAAFVIWRFRCNRASERRRQ